ncbi:MAG: hypothetical protein ACYC7D_12460 [Nitrososphaerales archaeon]
MASKLGILFSKGAVLSIVFILVAVGVFAAYVGLVTQPGASTHIEFPSYAGSINQTIGLKLGALLNGTTITNYYPNSTAILVTLSDSNLLSTQNKQPAANNWPIANLSAGACVNNSPFGIDVFKGYYASTNVSRAGSALRVFGEPACIISQSPTSFTFSPANDSNSAISSNITLDGTCCRLIPQEGCGNDCFTQIMAPFSTGTYTIAAGDEWGNLVFLHFSVVSPPASLITGSATHRITILNTSVYIPPCSCLTDYSYEIKAQFTGNDSWPINLIEFGIVTNNHTIEYAYPPLQGNDSIGALTLKPNQSVTGNISFFIPNGQYPLTLDYNNSAARIFLSTSSIPAPSVWISQIYGVNDSVSGSNDSGFIVQGTIYNTSTYFYSGDKILVVLSLTNTRPDSSVTINSLSISGGLDISGITPSLPISVGATPVTVYVWIVIPKTVSYSGNLYFFIHTS